MSNINVGSPRPPRVSSARSLSTFKCRLSTFHIQFSRKFSSPHHRNHNPPHQLRALCAPSSVNSALKLLPFPPSNSASDYSLFVTFSSHPFTTQRPPASAHLIALIGFPA